MENESVNPQVVNVLDPDTQQIGSIPSHQLQDALSQGYQQVDDNQVAEFLKKQKYETPGQQALTLAEGATSAASFGLIPGFGNKEDIRGRREINPGLHMAGQIGGIAATGPLGEFGAAKVLSRAGEAGAEALGLTGATTLK
jgi:hypothetical protein